MDKRTDLLLIVILAASSLIAVEATQALISKPFVPVFTLKYVDYSYDVPSTIHYEIDPYTGKEVKVGEDGYHVDNRSVEITIKNQPVNKDYHLYFNVRSKGYFGENWYDFFTYSLIDRISENVNYTLRSDYLSTYGPEQSDSEYTLISIPKGAFPQNSKIDFQVQALLAQETKYYYPYHSEWVTWGGEYVPTVAFVDVSEWSETQTVDLDWNPSTNQPGAAESGIALSFNWEQITIVVLLVAVVLLSIAVVYFRRKSAKRTP